LRVAFGIVGGVFLVQLAAGVYGLVGPMIVMALYGVEGVVIAILLLASTSIRAYFSE
jgi:hypothetical protein